MEEHIHFYKLFYDNGLKKPERDNVTGEQKTKTVFPGLEDLVEKLSKITEGVEDKLSTIWINNPRCVIVTRFSGTGGNSFGGVSKDIREVGLTDGSTKHKLVFVISKKDGNYCWAKEDWKNLRGVSWTSHMDGLNEPGVPLDECVQGILEKIYEELKII